MKKLWIGAAAGTAVLLLALVFIGCPQDENTVTIEVTKANKVKSVSVARTDNFKFLILTWDAADNVDKYNVYYQRENKKGIHSVPVITSGGSSMGNAQNAQVYAIADGAQSANPDEDKWSCKIQIASPTPAWVTVGKYRFGIQTTHRNNTSPLTHVPSDIVWSDLVDLP